MEIGKRCNPGHFLFLSSRAGVKPLAVKWLILLCPHLKHWGSLCFCPQIFSVSTLSVTDFFFFALFFLLLLHVNDFHAYLTFLSSQLP